MHSTISSKKPYSVALVDFRVLSPFFFGALVNFCDPITKIYQSRKLGIGWNDLECGVILGTVRLSDIVWYDTNQLDARQGEHMKGPGGSVH